MTPPLQDRDPESGCPVCVRHGLDRPDAPVRVGPVRLAAVLLRASAAVAAAALAARLAPDPIDIQPRVLRTA